MVDPRNCKWSRLGYNGRYGYTGLLGPDLAGCDAQGLGLRILDYLGPSTALLAPQLAGNSSSPLVLCRCDDWDMVDAQQKYAGQ